MKKKLMAVAAAGVLTVATAVPALALENEFHGMFRLFGYVSNFTDGAGGFVTTGTGTGDLAKDAKTRTYAEQRARLLYSAKANDDLKLITHFEIDSRWGDASYAVNRGQGGAIGADQVNLETKNVYLDFNIPTTAVNVKAGIQPWTDSYGGILVNADQAGVLASGKYAGFSNSIGWFRFNEDLRPSSTFNATTGVTTTTNTTFPGRATRDFFVADAKYNLTKDVKLGGSYYLLTDDRTSANTYTHMLGLNAEVKLDPVTVTGFGLYQFGDTPGVGNSDLNAFALGALAKAKVGIGTAKAALLYTSGEQGSVAAGRDSSAFQAIAPESNFFAADMMIMLRSKWNINTDRALVHNLNNNNNGFFGAFVGYDANITNKLYANANVGLGAAAQLRNKGTATEPDSNFLGTEINAEVGYKVFDNMTASLQGAYVVLGDFFQKPKGGADRNLDDPYLTRVMLNYAF